MSAPWFARTSSGSNTWASLVGLTPVTSDFSAIWSIGGAVTSDFTASWGIGKSVTSDFTASWTVGVVGGANSPWFARTTGASNTWAGSIIGVGTISAAASFPI